MLSVAAVSVVTKTGVAVTASAVASGSNVAVVLALLLL